MNTVRIFLSSPSDVLPERERAEQVVRRLDGELGGAVRLRALRWERQFYTAAQSFQDQISRPADCDVVVCILWKRLGAELPPHYRRPDGSIPTGTEYEFEDAIGAARARGTPDLLVYRKTAPVLLDAENVDLERAQFDRLKSFWERWFRDAAGHFSAAYHGFETTDGFETVLEEHLRQWLARRQTLEADAVRWPIALKGSPFRGLRSFDAAQAPVFFGRRRATERMREQMTAVVARGGTPFLLIVGQSGAGKSSIARAGLLPRLTQPGAVPGIDAWRAAAMRPSESGGGDAVAALCAALYGPGALPELSRGDSPTPADFAALLRASPAAAARAARLALGRAAAAGAAAAGFDRAPVARLLLVVDQLEEALALSPPARQAFAGALRALAQEGGGAVWVVATLRGDFYAAFQAVPDLVALKEAGAQFDLLAPAPAEIADIIAGPAQAAGLRYDRRDGVGLDEMLLQDAAEPGSLPLLQLALDALFHARDPGAAGPGAGGSGGTLTWAAYDGFGGLRGVVEQRAEATLAEMDAPARAALPRVLAALVSIGDDGLISGRAVPRAHAAPDAASARLIDAFVAARLMVGAADVAAGGLIRVAHEALLTAWPRARDAIAADRAFLATRGRLETAARQWTRGGQDPDDLLPAGRKLAEAVELAEQRPDLLTTATEEYLAASRVADAKRVAAERARAEHALRLETDAARARAEAATRVVRRTRVAVAVVSVLLLAAIAAGGYAALQRRTAIARTHEAERNFGLALDAGSAVVAAVFDHMRTGGLKADAARDLLERAAGTFGTLAALGQTPELASRQARLDGELSDARLLLGDSAGAMSAAGRGAALARTMLASDPDEPVWQRSLAVMQAKVGAAALHQGRNDEALAAYRGSMALCERLVAREPANAQWQRDLGIARDGVTKVLRARHDLPGALLLVRQTLAASEAAAAARPDDAGAQHDLDVALENTGDVLTELGRRDEALVLFRRDLDIALRLLAREPANTDWRLNAAISRERVGDALLARGDADAAAEQLRQAVAASDELAARDRDNAEWQEDDAIAHVHLANADLAAGHPADALTEERAAEAVYRTLIARDPGNDELKGQLAVIQVDEARAMQAADDLPGALAMIAEAVKAREAIAGGADTPGGRHDMMIARDALVGLLLLSGRPADAVAPARALRDAALRNASGDDADAQARIELAMADARLGDVLMQTRDVAGAAEAYGAEDEVIEALAAQHPDDPAMRRQLALARRNMGDVAGRLGDGPTALTRLRDALSIFQPLADAAPMNPLAQTDLVLTHTRLSNALMQLGERDQAAVEVRAARDVLDAALARLPNNAGLARQRRLLEPLLAIFRQD